MKVFEFNSENYYKKNSSNLNTQVNLDGLEAKFHKKYDYHHPKNYIFNEKFVIEELTDKQGLFFVEFTGNGISARAIIQKGSLTLVNKKTIAGDLCFILDDE